MTWFENDGRQLIPEIWFSVQCDEDAAIESFSGEITESCLIGNGDEHNEVGFTHPFLRDLTVVLREIEGGMRTLRCLEADREILPGDDVQAVKIFVILRTLGGAHGLSSR